MDKMLLDRVASRLQETKQQILRTAELARTGRLVEAEESDRRKLAAQDRNKRLFGAASGYAGRSGGAEAIIDTPDFVPVAYMERGLHVARAVARISTLQRRGLGTGFLCSGGVLITNHHVIPSKTQARGLIVEFNYELNYDGSERAVSAYRLDPDRLFLSDGTDGLDVTLVALGERVLGGSALSDFGWCGLSDSGSKHAIGDYVTIVQHPDGRHKEVVLRENLIAGRHDLALHYMADTQPGSSGSPVFNAEWMPIALHHWGGAHAWGGSGGYLPHTINEGIRISQIVRWLRAQRPVLNSAELALVDDVLEKGELGFAEQVRTTGPTAPTAARDPLAARMNSRGGMTWTLPLEISVNLPCAADAGLPSDLMSPASSEAPGESPPQNYSPDNSQAVGRSQSAERAIAPGRSGYRSDFIDGFLIPLPALSLQQQAQLARILPEKREPGANDWELRYQHFSIAMNGERRLAFYTAVNIHGASLRGLKRETGEFYDFTSGATAFAENRSGAEAVDWSEDDRIAKQQQTGRSFYTGATERLVESHGIGDLDETINFDRGHLVRRLDPCWGTDEHAKQAEADTFFYTNAAPQVGNFNRGNARGLLGATTGRLWQGIENYVLRNAWAMDSKISLFTGPIFEDDDPVYSNKAGTDQVQIPRRFWKVVVWAEGDALKSLALMADQTPTMIDRSGRESLTDAAQLALMQPFLTTLAEVEQASGLLFGDLLRNADIRKGLPNTPDRGAENRIFANEGLLQRSAATMPALSDLASGMFNPELAAQIMRVAESDTGDETANSDRTASHVGSESLWTFGAADRLWDRIKSGRFEGRLKVIWDGFFDQDGKPKFVYEPDPADPFRFVRANRKKQVIQPGVMDTDGGSVPRVLHSLGRFDPWSYAPGYIIHDWIFSAHKCGFEPDDAISFDDSALILAECIKTLMEKGFTNYDGETVKLPKREDTLYLIYQAVASPIARGIWDDDESVACREQKQNQ